MTMTAKASRRVAVTLLGVCALLTVAGLALYLTHRSEAAPATFGSRDATAATAVAFLSFPVFGALIARRRPDSPMWWMFSVVGLTMAVWVAADGWVVHALVTRPQPPGVEIAALIGNTVWIPGWGLVGLLFLRFPSGDLPSRRWSPALALVAVAPVTLAAGVMLQPGALPDYPGVANPLDPAIPRAVANAVLHVGNGLIALLGVVAVAALVVRLRRARGLERQQLKWLTYAATLVVISIAVWTVLQPLGVRSAWAEPLSTLSSVGIPIGAGLAILRYRLYDIDRIISKTVAYGLLSTLLTLTYAAAAIVLAQFEPLVGDSGVTVAGSTLAAAVIARPARDRLQVIVDRRFHRTHTDARAVLDAYRSRARNEVDLDGLTTELMTAVASTVAPATVALWLAPKAGSGPAASRRTDR